MISKRLFDLFFTLPGLMLLSPLFVIIAIWIKIDSPGPIFFRQERVGKHGKLFRIFKFRTMCVNAEMKGRQITVGVDPRITNSGLLLRKYKLDELPQLLNVLIGNMSLVGPRPEVPRYINLYPNDVRDKVLSVNPGITDYTSIEFKDENHILGLSNDPDKTYIEEILPIKQTYYLRYINERSMLIDFVIILRTIKAIVY